MKKDMVISLRKRLNRVALEKNGPSSVAEFCYDKFNYPKSDIMDLVTDRVSLYDATDETAYCLAFAVDTLYNTDYITTYYSPKEIEKYKNFKVSRERSIKEIIIPAIEIEADRQWIGSISAKELLEWEKLGKIRYNTEKQRVRKQFIRKGEIAYKLDVKERSVKQIADLMQRGEYIPDIITLDLPADEDSSLNWRYDRDKRDFVIKNIDHFDITDGFHRLLAMKRCKMSDPAFDYPMELRITLFSIHRTQAFIYQQDQKNKMSVTNSNSMNKDRASNKVVERLNENGNGCNISGQIKRSGGVLDYSALSDIVEYYWFNSKGKKYSNKDIADVMAEVRTIINVFVDTNPEYYEKYIDFKILATYFYFIKGANIEPGIAARRVVELYNTGRLDEITLRKARKSLFDKLESMHLG